MQTITNETLELVKRAKNDFDAVKKLLKAKPELLAEWDQDGEIQALNNTADALVTLEFGVQAALDMRPGTLNDENGYRIASCFGRDDSISINGDDAMSYENAKKLRDWLTAIINWNDKRTKGAQDVEN